MIEIIDESKNKGNYSGAHKSLTLCSGAHTKSNGKIAKTACFFDVFSKKSKFYHKKLSVLRRQASSSSSS